MVLLIFDWQVATGDGSVQDTHECHLTVWVIDSEWTRRSGLGAWREIVGPHHPLRHGKAYESK